MKYKQETRSIAEKLISQHKHWQNLKTSTPPSHNIESNYKDTFFNQGRSARNTKIYKVSGKSLSLLIKINLVQSIEARLIKSQREKLGFNLKIQKAKQPATGSYLGFSPKMMILAPGISEWDYVCELSPTIFLRLWLKVCTTGIKGKIYLASMITSVAIGIKGVCYHHLVCKVAQWGSFTLWYSGKLYLLKYK